MNFAGKVISPPTGEQIYSIGAELTSNEKKYALVKQTTRSHNLLCQNLLLSIS